MLTWTNERPTLAGFFWFKGSLEGKLTHRQVVMATMVEVTRLDEQFITWFPRGEASAADSAAWPFLRSNCD